MPDQTPVSARIDPALDTRRLLLYFGGLITVYVAAVVIGNPRWGGGEDQLSKVAFGVMFAPAIGAALASVFGPGIIRFGKLSWWIFAAYLPTLAVLVMTFAASAVGLVDLHWDGFRWVLGLVSFGSCAAALGEEIGWRGFLWPLLRRRSSFVVTTAIMWLVWLGYHVPMVIGGLYGSVGGLPAFTVSMAGFVMFVGVLTERSRSIWPSVLAHGMWNELVSTRFSGGPALHQMFTGSDALLGEFGWLAALAMLALGVATAAWHVRTPTRDGLSPRLPMGYGSEEMQCRAFRTGKKKPEAASDVA